MRFTPTCVGKTINADDPRAPVPVHPHMRGEDNVYGTDRFYEVGSPPHAWGRRAGCREVARTGRFTPTCVGKTLRVLSSCNGTSVHPHMRGEDLMYIQCLLVHLGSPPHAWGRLKCYQFVCPRCRFTPTCVGKTLRQSSDR